MKHFETAKEINKILEKIEASMIEDHIEREILKLLLIMAKTEKEIEEAKKERAKANEKLESILQELF